MTANSISEIERKRLAGKERAKKRGRSKEGLVVRIYGDQRSHSKERGHPAPNYVLEELRAWIFGRPNFEALFQNWVESGFEKAKRPSCDRLDDYKPYTFNNLQLVTWAENEARGNADMKAGINNKQSKAVIQLTKEGEFIAEHHSANHASRVTGVHQGHLSACCRRERKSAGGFVWIFA